MTKRSVKYMIAVMMLLAVALYFIAGTYARYIDTYTGTGSIDVAKWAVALTSGGSAVESNNLTLKFEPVDNEFVVKGKIAPDVEAVAEVEIDLTGTEVAVDIDAVVDKEKFKEVLTETYGTVPERITIDSKIYGGPEFAEPQAEDVISLPSGQAFTRENGKFKVKITAKWTHENDSSNKNSQANQDDTKAGKAAQAGTLSALEIPVTLTVQQHVKSDS